jgi:hypothetical protein
MIGPRFKIVRGIAIFAVIALNSFASKVDAVGRDSQSENPLSSIGAPLDVSAWRFRKPVKAAPDGVQQLELDLHVLSYGAPSLSDLRLVQDNRQIPYIVEDQPIRRSFKPGFRPRDDGSHAQVSLWTISLPHRGAPIVSLTLTAATPYFKRSVRLWERGQDESRNGFTFSSTTWTRTPENGEGTLTLLLQRRPKGQELMLEIQNGDNPPVDLREPTGIYAARRILFSAPPGTNIFLYYGHDKAPAPRYDLELLTPRLVNASRADAILGEEQRLRADPLAVRVQGSMKTIFWMTLGFVVAGLLFAILFLLPKTKTENQPAPGSA